MSSHNTKTDKPDYTMDDFRAEMRRRAAQGKALKHPPRALKTGRAALNHAPRLKRDQNQNLTQIVGCACGWRTPPGVADSEDAFIQHAAVMR